MFDDFDLDIQKIELDPMGLPGGPTTATLNNCPTFAGASCRGNCAPDTIGCQTANCPPQSLGCKTYNGCPTQGCPSTLGSACGLQTLQDCRTVVPCV